LILSPVNNIDVCNFADDTSPSVCDMDLKVVLEKLEFHSDLALGWFESNFMKLNTDKCHLLVSGHKHEEMWIRVGQDKIWEDKSVKLLGVTIDNSLKFDQHVTDICSKANRKLGALSRLCKYIDLKKRRILYKSFIESQFKYCPLIWMFHSRYSNNKINKLHKRALRLVYNDYESSFDFLLCKDNSFTIHHQNIQRLAIEIYKDIQNSSTGVFKELLIPNIRPINRSNADFQIPSINSVLMGQNSLRYFAPLIWNTIPLDIRNLKSLKLFESKIKTWKPVDCPCRLCKNYLDGVGFVNIVE